MLQPLIKDTKSFPQTSKKSAAKKLPGWTSPPKNLTLAAQEFLLAKLCASGIITSAMFETGFYYGILAHQYHIAIGAPGGIKIRGYDLTEVPLVHRLKYSLKTTVLSPSQERYLQKIEQYWKMSQRALLSLDIDNRVSLHLFDTLLIKNKLPPLPLKKYQKILQQGLMVLGQCYGICESKKASYLPKKEKMSNTYPQENLMKKIDPPPTNTATY